MDMRPVTRIGVTMREASAEGYAEERDALAVDWPRFLQDVMPGVAWMPVPNVGDGVASFVENWSLDGFILTGGGDARSNTRRRETEQTILRLAADRTLPVLGVCRGYQAMALAFGAALAPCDPATHRAARHPVRFSVPGLWPSLAGRSADVNSYHELSPAAGTLDEAFEVLAEAPDGTIEAAAHRRLPFCGVLWHPEREDRVADHDRNLVRMLFGFNGT